MAPIPHKVGKLERIVAGTFQENRQTSGVNEGRHDARCHHVQSGMAGGGDGHRLAFQFKATGNEAIPQIELLSGVAEIALRGGSAVPFCQGQSEPTQI